MYQRTVERRSPRSRTGKLRIARASTWMSLRCWRYSRSVHCPAVSEPLAFIVSALRLFVNCLLTRESSTAINLLRTRLQASGSPGHPTVYTGFLDVANQTLAREGWQGLYKGLVPTLAKVVPAVSISYVVSGRAPVLRQLSLNLFLL